MDTSHWPVMQLISEEFSDDVTAVNTIHAAVTNPRWTVTRAYMYTHTRAGGSRHYPANGSDGVRDSQLITAYPIMDKSPPSGRSVQKYCSSLPYREDGAISSGKVINS